MHFWRAVIGITGRIQGLRLRMRITIAGIRIRISVLSFLQIQDSCGDYSCLNPSTLSKGKIHNGERMQLVPKGKAVFF